MRSLRAGRVVTRRLDCGVRQPRSVKIAALTNDEADMRHQPTAAEKARLQTIATLRMQLPVVAIVGIGIAIAVSVLIAPGSVLPAIIAVTAAVILLGQLIYVSFCLRCPRCSGWIVLPKCPSCGLGLNGSDKSNPL